MKEINFKKHINSTLDNAIEKVTALLKEEGFGVLTRIDLHAKIKEKIGKDINPTVILGACNPNLAYEAFQLNPDVTSLLPCNVVIRQLNDDIFSVEIARPTSLLDMLGDASLTAKALDAESKLKRIIDQI